MSQGTPQISSAVHDSVRTASWQDVDVTRRRRASVVEQAFVEGDEVLEWIQHVLGERFAESGAQLLDALQDGVRLCALVQRIDPSLDLRFNARAAPGSFHAKDNVAIFLRACEENLGISRLQLFESNDLCERRNERRVVQTLLDVSRAAMRFGFEPPLLVQYELEIEAEEAAAAAAAAEAGVSTAAADGSGAPDFARLTLRHVDMHAHEGDANDEDDAELLAAMSAAERSAVRTQRIAEFERLRDAANAQARAAAEAEAAALHGSVQEREQARLARLRAETDARDAEAAAHRHATAAAREARAAAAARLAAGHEGPAPLPLAPTEGATRPIAFTLGSARSSAAATSPDRGRAVHRDEEEEEEEEEEEAEQVELYAASVQSDPSMALSEVGGSESPSTASALIGSPSAELRLQQQRQSQSHRAPTVAVSVPSAASSFAAPPRVRSANTRRSGAPAGLEAATEDAVDRAVAACLEEVLGAHGPSNLSIYKVKRGCYQVGDGPPTYLRLVRNLLLARVGGGWMSFRAILLRKLSLRARASVEHNMVAPT